MDDRRKAQIAKNEALFRGLNESIERASGHPDLAERLAFVCECGNEKCFENITLNHEQYRALRTKPDRFAVLPGHEIPEAERIVSRHDGFLVAEKTGVGSQVAKDLDPGTENGGSPG